MNDFKPLRALALCAALLLAACKPAAAPADIASAPLAGARIGAPFALTGQDGKTVKDSDFAGKYRIVYFGYTFCPDVCPVDVQNLMSGLKLFEKAHPAEGAKVQPLFITVDPARDTPAALTQFTANFHPRLIGLTGSPEAIAALAKAYGVFFKAEPSADPKAYLVSHTRQAYLMGPKGEPILLLSQDGKPQAISDELAAWVR